MELHEWITAKKLDVTQNGSIYDLDGKTYLHIHQKNGKILDENLTLIFSEGKEYPKVDYYLYSFGGNWYYTDKRDIDDFYEFNYIGKAKIKYNDDLPFLGIHSGYDLTNGSRSYEDWIVKAKFLGVSQLGICENHTLAGSVKFQQACAKAGMRSIIGETVTVMGATDYKVKLYVKNETGWRNLLNIHKLLTVDGKGELVSEEDVLKRSEGLIVVFDSMTMLSEELLNSYSEAFVDDMYYQFDCSEYLSGTHEIAHLTALKHAWDHHRNDINFVLISDAYYLDQEHAHIKKKLNHMGKTFSHNSNDEYFKSSGEYFAEMFAIIKDLDKTSTMYRLFRTNTKALVNKIDFHIKIKEEFYLPKYNMTEEESDHYENNEEYFWDMIQTGLKFNKIEPTDAVYERIEKEMAVIMKGGFIDYFMILADIINWAKGQGILVGIARGSVGGSLVAYLVGITSLNPLDNGLMFERFLNEGRIGSSLPDIDVDFQGNRRDDVKHYMQDRYGHDNVCSIGTYTTLKLKQALKDLGRERYYTPAKMNYITSLIATEGKSWSEIFELASMSEHFKDFVQGDVAMINDIKLILNQHKTRSIHAAGIVITPSYYKGDKMNVWDWMPVREMDGMLVSEWEGTVIEDTGFLKEDILGLKQLDKFKDIYDLIELRGDKVKDWEDYDYEDYSVYRYFHKGFNQDVFQFNGMGMAIYSRDLKPDNLGELIAMNALYRPGAMDSNAHIDYVDLKYGRKRPYYDYMLEAVTKETSGLYIYQEQIMQAVQVLGGFNLNEADDVRKAMGKKKADVMEKSHAKFVDGAIALKCSREEAERVWKKLEVFSGYGFNKAHAEAYGKMGYVSQWLKKYYPLEFWSVSLKYAEKEDVPARLAEMSQLGHITIHTPDINASGVGFNFSYEERVIYWSLTQITQIGEVVVQNIVDERENGNFKSFSDAWNRLPKSKVNKGVLFNLILAGVFDEVEGIDEAHLYKRYSLVQQWSEITKTPMPKEINLDLIGKKWYWVNLQKKLSGLGQFNYREMLKDYPNLSVANYITEQEIAFKENIDRRILVCGMVVKIIKKKAKNGAFIVLNLEGNTGLFSTIVWNATYMKYENELKGAEGQILAIEGRVREDKYRGGQVVHTLKSSNIIFINV
jgi:DNA polymerase-3 subunit alpha